VTTSVKTAEIETDHTDTAEFWHQWKFQWGELYWCLITTMDANLWWNVLKLL